MPHFASLTDINALGNNIGLGPAQLEYKLRLLALADLGSQNIGQDLPYAQVAAVLQVAPTEVECWVIDGSSALPLSLPVADADSPWTFGFPTPSDPSGSSDKQARTASARHRSFPVAPSLPFPSQVLLRRASNPPTDAIGIAHPSSADATNARRLDNCQINVSHASTTPCRSKLSLGPRFVGYACYCL